MPKRFVYDYYKVSVPGDCDDSIEALADIAINQAREQARLYCIPCAWNAELVSGELGDFECTFKVTRKRNRKGSTR
jgi:hypothetical protein